MPRREFLCVRIYSLMLFTTRTLLKSLVDSDGRSRVSMSLDATCVVVFVNSVVRLCVLDACWINDVMLPLIKMLCTQ